jgi:hypothetical protein
LASLHSAGWRQGSFLRHKLPADSIVAGEDGKPTRLTVEHNLWVVVSHDCDLAWADKKAETPLIELRPIYTANPPKPLGLRSKQLRLEKAADWYLEAQSPRGMVTPAALTAMAGAGAGVLENVLSPGALIRLKSWLGRRYDRPAVPDDLVDLGRAICTAVKAHESDPLLTRIREIFWQFERGEPVRFSLYALIEHEDDTEKAEEFLAAVALDVPVHLGVSDEQVARTASKFTLELLETSLTADLSDLTWSQGEPQQEVADP